MRSDSGRLEATLASVKTYKQRRPPAEREPPTPRGVPNPSFQMIHERVSDARQHVRA